MRSCTSAFLRTYLLAVLLMRLATLFSHPAFLRTCFHVHLLSSGLPACLPTQPTFLPFFASCLFSHLL
jgi:hypothetical protein